MRFAWIRSNQEPEKKPSTRPIDRFAMITYNVVWWIPVAATVTGLVSYTVGLFGFLSITAVRAAVNAYRNNVMPFEAAMSFPLRSP